MRMLGLSLAAAMLAVLIGGDAALADWSWPWSSKESAKPAKSSQPSTLSKMGTSTKNFLGGMFGSKKPDPKKRTVNSPYSPYARKKEAKKEPWPGSWFKPKETPPPKSTDEWMQLQPIRP